MYKKTGIWAIFHAFSTRKFFPKMTLLRLILCEESIVRISNASLTNSGELECVYWSENRNFLDVVSKNDFLGVNLCGESIARIPGAWKRFSDSVNRSVCIETMTNFSLIQDQGNVFKLRKCAQSIPHLNLPLENLKFSIFASIHTPQFPD